MNYLTPGNSVTATRWNDLFAQAETVLANALGGLSAVFVGVDKQWDRGFFFGFDPMNLPTTLHPVAANFLKNSYLGNAPTYQNAMFWRQYNHSAITGALSGLSQSSNTSKWNVVKLALPTWAVWSAAIYPSGFTGTPYTTQGLKQTISSVDYPAYNCLDVSLQVHTASVGGTPYNVTFDTVLDAEHAQPLKGIDVFVLGSVTWDTTNWNKYSIVRAHNCGKTAATIFSTSINPGASQCFRNLAGTWTAQGNYFHRMQPGDGRFVQMREANNAAPAIFQPAVVADVLAKTLGISTSNFSKFPDVAKFCDLSPVYNNAAYAKTSVSENNPPVNGYFPALGSGAPIGDFIIHRGKVLVANRAVPNTIHATMTIVPAMGVNIDFVDGTNTVANVSNMAVFDITTGVSIPAEGTPGNPATTNWAVNYGTQQFAFIPQTGYITAGDQLRITFDYIPPDDHVWVDFDSFASLASRLTAVGLLSRALSETNPYGGTLSNLEIYSASSWHLIDLSCPLVTFLTGGGAPLPAKVIGSTQASSPASIKLPWLWFNCATVVANPSTTNFGYKNWITDSSGNPALGTTVTVPVTQDGSTQDSNTNVFLPTDPVSTVESWIQTQSQAGGVLTVGSFQMFSTTFGHVLTWDEVWPLDAKFTAIWLFIGPSSVAGATRTIKVIYEPNVGLHVMRGIFLNETRFFNSFGYSNPDELGPWLHGVFPPIGGFENSLWSARRFMFWNYCRVDRQFQNSRYYQHLAGDTPWMPNTGYSNQKFPTGFLGLTLDELSTNEFNNVVSFYEAAPLGVDTVGSAVPKGKPTISRMGIFSSTPDIWSPFAYWLAKITNLTYATGGGTGSITTTSGWYAANNGSIMSNATIGNPIPNVLPCQMEHYNSLASLVNSQPAMRYQLGSFGDTTFTLNFAAGNIIIVDGGSGFTVGQALNFNLKVGSVDGNGAILTVAQNGSVVTDSYDAYSTPVRPFTLGGNATCDTSVGDGSTLTFIPTHTNIGVPTVPTPPNSAGDDYHDRMADGYCPRTAWFSWNGATPGGADPVADYLTTLGVTVQTTVPDNYGTPLPIYEYDLHNDGALTSNRVASYAYGCSPDFQIKVNAYRWISIDDARTLYGNFSLPFVLSETVVPYSWQVFNVTGNVTTIQDTTQSNNSYFPYLGPANTTFNATNYPTWTLYSTCHPPDNSGGGDLGPVNQIQADYFNDASGNWVRPYRNENVCSASSPLAGPIRYWIVWSSVTTGPATADWNFSVSSCIGYHHVYAYGGPVLSDQWEGYCDYQERTISQKIDYAIPAQFAPAGFITAAMINFPQKRSYNLFAVLARYEGCADQCVACLPQNVGYYDEPWVAANLSVYYNLGGSVVPIIGDNSIEGSQPDVAYISGTGGVGQYETIITTGLLNARLVTIPVDGQIQNNNPQPPGGGI